LSGEFNVFRLLPAGTATAKVAVTGESGIEVCEVLMYLR